jgi:hypothetical protein
LDAIHSRIRNRPNAPVLVGPESESITEFLTQAVPLRTRTYPGINAFHNYNIADQAGIDGAIPKLNLIRDESDLTGRLNWMSEFSKGEFDWLDTAQVIHNTLVEANSSAYIFFKLVWGNTTDTGENRASKPPSTSDFGLSGAAEAGCASPPGGRGPLGAAQK